MKHILSVLLLLVTPSLALADQGPPEPSRTRGHGPSSSSGFSHRFQLEPHRYDTPQVNIHFGLSQPLLLSGFNAAVDLRRGRWVFEYSHGTNLDYTANPAIGSRFVGASDVSLTSPWTTGGGIGYTLVDDLYVMLELKAHRYELESEDTMRAYTTASIGPALAYRLFLWKGLDVTAYARFWPNVWSSRDNVSVGGQTFDPVNLGFFGNLSVGWAFDVP